MFYFNLNDVNVCLRILFLNKISACVCLCEQSFIF